MKQWHELKEFNFKAQPRREIRKKIHAFYADNYPLPVFTDPSILMLLSCQLSGPGQLAGDQCCYGASSYHEWGHSHGHGSWGPPSLPQCSACWSTWVHVFSSKQWGMLGGKLNNVTIPSTFLLCWLYACIHTSTL